MESFFTRPVILDQSIRGSHRRGMLVGASVPSLLDLHATVPAELLRDDSTVP